MKLKKLLSLTLTGAMAISMLAGCGGNPESQATQTSAQGDSTDEGADASGDSGSVDSGTADASDDGADSRGNDRDYSCVKNSGTVDESASEAVEEAVNEITQKEINVAVDLMWVDSAKYETQVPMMITAMKRWT